MREEWGMSRFWLRAVLWMMTPWSLILSAGCAAADQPSLQPDADETEVYSVFLRQFQDTRHSKLDVARFTHAAPNMSHPGNLSCVDGLKMVEIRTPRLAVSLEKLAETAGVPFTLVGPDNGVTKPEVMPPPPPPAAADDDSSTPEQAIAKRQRELQNMSPPDEHGLLTLSRIAFDVSRSYALLSYSYSCGGLCGEGGSLLLVKASGKWVIARRCSTQIS
jgi:hypothetical protein